FGGLVDSKGRYVWCCMDKFDGDPVFNCLINNNSDKTGFYDVVLEDFATSKQTYQDNSTVLVTTLSTGKGDVVEIRDFAPRFVHYDRVFRPFQIIRIVKRVQGDPRVSIRIRPTFQYNSTDGYQTRGSQHVRFCGPTNTWRVTTNIPIRRILEEMPFLVSDEPVIIIFGSDESFTNSLSQVAAEFETKTIKYWKQWCNTLFLPVEYQEVLALISNPKHVAFNLVNQCLVISASKAVIHGSCTHHCSHSENAKHSASQLLWLLCSSVLVHLLLCLILIKNLKKITKILLNLLFF
ncbi:unnamed protein product, partial [Polarella glacialis]